MEILLSAIMASLLKIILAVAKSAARYASLPTVDAGKTPTRFFTAKIVNSNLRKEMTKMENSTYKKYSNEFNGLTFITFENGETESFTSDEESETWLKEHYPEAMQGKDSIESRPCLDCDPEGLPLCEKHRFWSQPIPSTMTIEEYENRNGPVR